MAGQHAALPGEKESSSSSPFVAAARRVRSLYPQEAKETTEERKSFLAALGRDSPPVDNDPTPNRVLCLPTTFPLRRLTTSSRRRLARRVGPHDPLGDRGLQRRAHLRRRARPSRRRTHPRTRSARRGQRSPHLRAWRSTRGL